MSPSDFQPARHPHERWLRYLDGTLLAEDVGQLNDQLHADTGLRRELAELLLLQVQLMEIGQEARVSRESRRDLLARGQGPIASADRVSQVERLAVPRRTQTVLSRGRPGRPKSLVSWSIALATSVAVLVGLSVWLFGSAIVEPVLTEVRGGDAAIERGTELIPATPGIRLQTADVVRTGTGTARISFAPENTVLTIQPNTEFSLTSLARGKHFVLHTGKIEALVASQPLFRPMIVGTPQAEVRVLGTRFTLTADTKATQLDVTEGKVRLTRTADGSVVRAIAGNPVEAATVPATGRILREYWTNYTGNFTQLMPADPTLAARPDGWDYLERFESKPLQRGLRFGERIRGYVHPPRTGLYLFSVARVHVEAALHLSRSDKPEEVVHVADRHPDGGGANLERVTPVLLQAGRKCYIEAVHESDGGDDRLTIMWHAPGRDPEIIPGEFLSPFPTKQEKGK